jgi:hypothetical protein
VNVVYYTSGVSGTGRLVRGVAIKNALLRKNIDFRFTILHSAPIAGFLGGNGQFKLPLETAQQTDSRHYENSAIYAHLMRLAPDLLIVDLLWVPLHSFLDEIRCKKIFLARQVSPDFFVFNDPGVSLRFNPQQYDRVLAIEPYDCPVTEEHINPIVIRNRHEVLPAEVAIDRLKLDPAKKHCLFSFNRPPEVCDKTRAEYASLADEGYEVFSTTLHADGVFPVVDYFNAFDLVICGGGYNAFWEAVYFKKKAVFIPTKARYENAWWRIETCRNYKFERNGADELAEIIESL